MTARRGGWRIWGAVFAAYLLVLQATLAAMTIGAHAGPMPTGLSGEVICSTAGTLSADLPGKDALPACCMSGCALFAVGQAPAPETASSPPPQVFAHASLRVPADDALAPAPEKSSRSKRAPPLTA